MFSKLKGNIFRYILDRYKRKKMRLSDVSQEHTLEVAKQMLEKTKYCLFISHNSNGWSSARMVEPITDVNEIVFWIGTHPKLRKVVEVQQNDKVTLAFMDDKENAGLVVYGRARIEDGLEVRKRRWKGTWRLFFEGGPESSDYIVIRVEPIRMEVMNFSRNVVQPPFGLKPSVLVKNDDGWVVA